jgi:hypothetical protein
MNPGQASGWEHKVVARDRGESPEDGSRTLIFRAKIEPAQKKSLR